MNIIGDKNSFAVQYKVESKVPFMGYGKVWFGGNFLGTEEDLIYLDGYLLSGLRNIYNSPEINLPVLPDSDILFKELFLRLGDSVEKCSYKYLINLGTMTDDFTIFSYLHNDAIHIVWKLHNNDTFFSDLKKLDVNDVSCYSITKKEYRDKLQEIEDHILSLQ